MHFPQSTSFLEDGKPKGHSETEHLVVLGGVLHVLGGVLHVLGGVLHVLGGVLHVLGGVLHVLGGVPSFRNYAQKGIGSRNVLLHFFYDVVYATVCHPINK